MRFVARRFAPWLFSLLVFVLCGEAVMRAFRIIDVMNGFPRRLFVAVDDPHLTYAMRPGMDLVLRGVRVQINEHGMRGPSTTLKPAAGVRRVLAVGDSATFGEGVPVEATWPALLQVELERRGGGRWEVLNAGVSGWNTEGELAYLQQRGLAFEPQIVVIAFNLNDYDYMPVLNPHGVLSLNRSDRISPWSLANWSELYMALRWFIRHGRSAWVGDPRWVAVPAHAGSFDPFDRSVSALRKRYYRAPGDERWQTLTLSLRGLGQIAVRRQIRFLTVILPDGDQFEGAGPDLLPQQKVMELCRIAGLDCVDLHAAFREAGGRRLFRDIMHPNADGYGVVARVVADRLLGTSAGGSGG